LSLACAAVAQAGDAPWPLDRVVLRGGKVLEGLIERQSDESLEMLEIRRKGSALFGVYQPVPRSEVATIQALSQSQRRTTRQQFDSYRNRVRIEAARMQDLEVVREGRRLCYRGDDFALESTAPEEVVRRSIVRIEQLFAAMRQMIPAHGAPPRPIVIRLFGSMQQYQEFVEKCGLPIANPAVFHRPTNTIAVGGELVRLNDQMRQIQSQHDDARTDLEKERAALAKTLEAFRLALDKSPASEAEKRSAMTRKKIELERGLAVRERELQRYERRNNLVFADATSRMFAMLYHEALHAYLENFVYPGDQYDVPRWLHEGLAQIFESSTLEGQTFRVEAPHEESLKLLQASLATVSLKELLSAEGDSFLVAHGENPHASRLNYAGSWGLAYYLTFQCQLTGSRAMDQFVSRSGEIDSPVGRFEALVQTPLPEFEAQWRAYITALKPGTPPAHKGAR
jgi:hypothetical protein